jgi:hypothetical protein
MRPSVACGTARGGPPPRTVPGASMSAPPSRSASSTDVVAARRPVRRRLGVRAMEARVDVGSGLNQRGDGGWAVGEVAGPVGCDVEERARHPLGIVVAESCCREIGMLSQQPLQPREITVCGLPPSATASVSCVPMVVTARGARVRAGPRAGRRARFRLGSASNRACDRRGGSRASRRRGSRRRCAPSPSSTRGAIPGRYWSSASKRRSRAIGASPKPAGEDSALPLLPEIRLPHARVGRRGC